MGEPSRREQNQPCGSANADVEGAHRRDRGRTNGQRPPVGGSN